MIVVEDHGYVPARCAQLGPNGVFMMRAVIRDFYRWGILLAFRYF